MGGTDEFVEQNGDPGSEIAALTARVAAMEQTLQLLLARTQPQPQTSQPSGIPAAQEQGRPSPRPNPQAGTQTLQSGSLAPAPAFAPASTGPAAPIEPQRTLESRIGSFFLNRIGVIAVMIGMAWFLKLAIDRNWVGPPVRIAIGLVLAVGLVLWSERFRRRKFAAFSFSLKALGTGIAYLSIWAAYSVYDLVSPGTAFAAMVVVTIANGFLAWLQDSELLAVYALAGGLATPALLSTGQNHELFLFSYLLLLDLGAIVLSALRPWNRLILGSFLGTAIYFGLWWAVYYSPDAFALTGVFLLLFFLLFTAAPLLALHLSSVDPQPGARIATPAFYDPIFREFMVTGLPIAVHAATFAAAWYWAGTSTGTGSTGNLHWLRSWLALALAISSLAVDLLVRNIDPVRPMQDRLADVHFGLAIFFVALAAWLQFHRYEIALCWLAEALVLAAVVNLAPAHHHHPHSPPDRVTTPRAYATLMLAAAFTSLLLLEWIDPPWYGTPAIFNAHFLTYLVGLAVFAAIAWICGKSINAPRAVSGTASAAASAAIARPVAANRTVAALRRTEVQPGNLIFLASFAVIAFNLIALVAGSVQIHLYWLQDELPRHAIRAVGSHTIGFSYSAWFMIYGAGLMAIGFLRRSGFLRWQALLLLALAIAKVFVIDASNLSQGYRVMSFLGLGALLLTISFAYQRDWLALRGPE